MLCKHERTKKHTEPGKGGEMWRGSCTGHNGGFYWSFATVAAGADSAAPAMLNESDVTSLPGVTINEFLCCVRRGSPCPPSLCLCTLYPNSEKDCQRRSVGKGRGPHCRRQRGSFSRTERLCKFVVLHARLRSDAETILHTG